MSQTTDLVPTPDGPAASTGEMGRLIQDFDWTSTPLGPRSGWPRSLRTLTEMLLVHPFAMIVLWGPDLVQIYNDPYRVIMGEKHPAGLGQRTRDCWPEVWDFNAPIYEGVMNRGESSQFTDQRLVIGRHGQDEEAFFTLTFSPVHDDAGAVGGVLVTVIETTERVRAQRQVQEHTRNIEEEARAQEAFAAFTEAVGAQTDVRALTREAIRVLRARFSDDSTFVYYEREEARWKARVWTEDLQDQPELLALLREGLPLDTPLYAEATCTRQPVFTEQWDAGRERVPHSEGYGAAANVPLVVGGEVRGFVALGLRHTHRWSERDQGVIRAVGRGLNLALERAEAARQLQEQNAELDARNRALEAFEEWSRDLSLDAEPFALVLRAQELLYTLLPVDAALYYEREDERWFIRSMWGGFGSEGLRLAHEAGLVHDETANLRRPFETGEPYYQDVYDPGTDGLADHMAHVSATAMLPLRTGRGVRGILGLAKFGRAGWSGTERTIFETVRRSLELALDRADQAAELVRERAALRERTDELSAANEELEAFTYSVSHDLRTPVRHVMSFNDLLRRQLEGSLDARATRHLQVVGEAAGRMNTLIDAMLDLSRTSRLPLRRGPVDLNELVRAVRSELDADVLERVVDWHVAPLPLVMADYDTLRQVVTNLLDNALKYTRTREVARIEVWAEERPGLWAVVVRDNGVGFDAQYANKLFGVFQRLHLTKDFEGTGVGLANVRRIITRHGGRVFAEGQPGEGATFGFTLPRP